MKTQSRISLHRIIVVLILGSLALVLAACGGESDPIPVYVTPTPQPSPTAAEMLNSTDVNGPDAPETVLASDSILRQTTITPIPTPEPPPAGVTFGPVTGSDFTPEPLHTALPEVVSEQACTALVTAPQLSLYATPDKAAGATGTVTELTTVAVLEFATDSAGNAWARTPTGWLTLTDTGTLTARLHDVRRCAIMRGEAPDTTLLGLHVLNDTQNEAVLAFVRRMAFAGKPVGTIKGLNGTEALLNEIEQISPQTVTVYRSLLHSGAPMGDCPVLDLDNLPAAAATAQSWVAGLQSYWGQVNADYFEVINECSWPLTWMSDFSIEAMRLANEQGRCLLIFSFPGGNPDMQHFNDLLPAYRYALDNPCAGGRQHGIALHAYSMQDGVPVSEADVWVGLRHRILAERLAVTQPLAVELPLYITELGIGGGTMFPGCDLVVSDALRYTYLLEEDAYVDGFHLWSVGTGTGWYDVAPCLPQLADALLTYYGK